jgi:glycosyltransferase involved in cell wall biosynthesis
MLTSELYPNWGGIGTYVTELARNMPSDIAVHIVTPQRTKLGKLTFDNDRTRLRENIHVYYFGTARDTFLHYFYFQLACLKSLPAFAKRLEIDVIHSQNTMPDLFLSPQRLGMPIISTVHSMEHERVPAIRVAARCSHCRISELERSEKMSLLFSQALRVAERAYYRNERYYIAVSQATKEQILRHYNVGEERIRVIFNGVNRSAFSSRNGAIAQKHFPDLVNIDAPKVLFLSRVTASKGAYMLMKAIPRILEKADAHFIFAGPGSKLPPCDCQDHITELGYVDYRLTMSLYGLADIFVLPSFYDNFPLTILEAMASGCAVIASNVGGIPEQIEHLHNGLLVRSGSVVDIVDAVVALIRDKPTRTNLGLNARRTIDEYFDWKRVADEVTAYYSWVLDESPSCQSAAPSRTHASRQRRPV